MKSSLLVLLPPEAPDLESVLFSLLEKHRIDDERPGTGRWDYWYPPDDPLTDPEKARWLYPGVDPSIAPFLGKASDIPSDDLWGAVLTGDGTWHDLMDFGWSLVRSSSWKSRMALWRWKKHHRALLQAHQDQLVASLMIHC